MSPWNIGTIRLTAKGTPDRRRLLVPSSLACCCLMLSPLATVALAASPPTTAPSADAEQELPELVTTYFRASSPQERRDVVSRLQHRKDVTLPALADAVRHVQLWSPQPPGLQAVIPEDYPSPPARGDLPPAYVRVPDDYDPARAYPLIILLDDRCLDGGVFLTIAEGLLGRRVNEFVVAAPTQLAGFTLDADEGDASSPPRLLDALRRRFHLDADRVYAVTSSGGADAGPPAATLYSDWFAGVITLQPPPVLDRLPEFCELLLPGCRDTPWLITASSTALNIAHLRQTSEQKGLPLQFTAEPAPSGDRPAARQLGDDLLGSILNRPRPRQVNLVEHWFRYPVQGRHSWLRMTKFQGQPWTAQLLAVAPAPGESYSQAVTAVLQDKLAFLGGRIEGQTIRIETRRCDEVTVLLNDEIIDLAQDITIYVDGTRRFAGRARPSLATLLDMAYQDWDFQRLWTVRFTIPAKGRAIQD